MPSDEQLAAFYADYSKTTKYSKRLRKKVFTARYKLKKARRHLTGNNRSFLDIGCNLGAVCEAARREGFDATGIDVDEPTIQRASELFPECRFENLTSYELARRGDKFDLVFCIEVIEHVPQTHDFVQSFRDVMNKGGVLYLTTPDAGHRRVPKEITQWSAVIPPEHIMLFKRSNIAWLLEQHSFEVIRFRPCHRANLRVIARAV